MVNTMFIWTEREAIENERKAKEELDALVKETITYYVIAPLSAKVYKKLHECKEDPTRNSWSIEADLLFDGDVIRHYEYAELLGLDLLMMQMDRIKIERPEAATT